MTYTTADFDYALPSELIAQEPLVERSRSRMITIDAAQQSFTDSDFQEIIDLIHPDDLIIFNDTRHLFSLVFTYLICWMKYYDINIL